jgi:TRAP transporter TAXI family solute receptor
VEVQRKIRFVSPSDEEIDKAVKANPFFTKDTIPPGGCYKSIQTPTLTPAYMVYWAGHKDFSADLVYQMLKAAFDPKNKTRVEAIHVSMKQLGPGLDAMAPMKIPLHPGAVKFWKEQGLSVPNELIPPEMKGS